MTTKYISNRLGMHLAIISFLAYIIVAVLSIILTFSEIVVVNGFIDGTLNIDNLFNITAHRHLLSNITIVIYITCRSLFVNWAYYANRNLEYFYDKAIKFDTWKMVFSFVIPIVNFYLPIVIMNKIWQATNPKLNTLEEINAQKTSKFIIVWWIINLVWIVFSIWNSIVKVIEQDFVRLKLYVQLTILGDILGIVVALMTIILIYIINTRIDTKYRSWKKELNYDHHI